MPPASGRKSASRPWALVLSGMIVGAARFAAGAVVGLLAVRAPKQITVHLDAPLIAVPPQRQPRSQPNANGQMPVVTWMPLTDTIGTTGSSPPPISAQEGER